MRTGKLKLSSGPNFAKFNLPVAELGVELINKSIGPLQLGAILSGSWLQ